jgi:hypothetical protein
MGSVETNSIVFIYYHNTQGAKASTNTNEVTSCLVYLGSVTANGFVDFYCLNDQGAKISVKTALVSVLTLSPRTL